MTRQTRSGSLVFAAGLFFIPASSSAQSLASVTAGTPPPASPAWTATAHEPAFAIPVRAQDPAGEPQEPPISFRFRQSPSLRIGDVLRMDFRVKVQGDFRGFDPVPDDKPKDREMEIARLGIEGRALRIVEYEFTYDLTDATTPWRDAYVNVHAKDFLQIQGGQFKVPFGRERLVGTTSLDFAERTVTSNELTPGRDNGVMVHGWLQSRKVVYAFSVTQGDIDPSADDRDDFAGTVGQLPDAGTTWAGRTTVRPFRFKDTDGWARNLEIGVAWTTGTLEEGLGGLRGRAMFGQVFFPEVYVQGRRLRLGVDAALTSGPFSVQGEYIRAQDDRKGQGLGDDDLPDLLAQGWWMSGTWVLTGENKSDVESPSRPLPMKGPGAIELATRFEKVRFKSSETGGDPPFRNPRAINLYPNSDTVWTGGINWYLNRFLKIQGNAIREEFEDPERTLLSGEDTFWTFVGRLQLVI